MSFADPQSVTIGTTPGTVSLPRTGSGVNTGAFTSNDGTTDVLVSHQYGKRTRRQARIDYKKIAPNPLISSENIQFSASVYLVVDLPQTGFTVSDAKDLVVALTTWLTASTNANTVKLLGGEN
jgi:hypothetical protein